MASDLEQQHLFEGSPLPGWLPDETLFSLLSRHHRVSCNLKDSTTSQQVFGPRRKRCAPDFPNWIDSLVERTRGSLGSAEDIIYQRTLLPVYLPFQTQEEARLCIDAMKGSGLGRLKARLCRQTADEQTVRPLRACPVCIADDLNDHQVAYWHTSHQLPGMLICLRHRVQLMTSTVPVSMHRTFRWVLPQDSEWSAPAWRLEDTGVAGSDLLQRVGQMSLHLFQSPPGFQFDARLLESAYLHALREKTGEPNPWEFSSMVQNAARMQAYFSCLHPVREFRAIGLKADRAVRMLNDSLSPDVQRWNSWSHLCVFTWLFSDWESSSIRYAARANT